MHHTVNTRFVEGLRENGLMVGAVVVIVSAMLFSGHKQAGAVPVPWPYGGPIVLMVPCTCDEPGSFQITTGPPNNNINRAGSVTVFRPGISVLFPWYILHPDALVVSGSTGVPDACMIVVPTVPPHCEALPAPQGTMLITGLSH